MTTPETQAEILRLHHAEGWPVGTIANQLGLHHGVVRRVLEKEGAAEAARLRPSKADPFVPFILSTLRRYPRLSAARLHQMVKERGYSGGADHFRSIVRRYRPSPPAEAYLRLKTMAGDQAQVDWGKFGKIEIGDAKRPLVGFVMVLSYSRAIFLRFFPGEQLSFFLEGHEEAFSRWGGVPRTILYDNLKSVVLDRVGDAIRFNEQLLAFAGHYRYEPRPVAPYRGNEKGRVERAIRYIRDNFIAARSFRDFEDANRQADEWAMTVSLQRPWVEDRSFTVEQALEKDQSALRGLPGNPFPSEERKEVRAGKTPYVRFDLNDYSIPHTRTRRILIVHADLRELRILDGGKEIARHKRSFDRHQQIEDPRHIAELRGKKRLSRKVASGDLLSRLVPSSVQLLEKLAEKHRPLGRVVKELEDLLRAYGEKELESAIREALSAGAAHPQAVRYILERRRERRGEPAALPLPLPDDPRIRNLAFRTHDLESYDAFLQEEDGKEEGDD